ncbi:MAG TPA: GNAT family N-acetyltransferase [Candidatus Nanopelagicaceae bacterium]|nr:GNAT family N-acetyltransferase [Candidatus Nanopelagicaceae bacterium]
MIVTDRYDPRLDRDALKEIFEDFIENKSYFISTWQEFEKEINKRVLDLQYRNSMVVAKEEGEIVGWGTYTLIKDYLGNKRALIHQVLTKKEDSYRKGIEEQIIRELKLYVKRTLNLDKVFLLCQDSDSALRNLVMKLGAKKSKNYWYENDI